MQEITLKLSEAWTELSVPLYEGSIHPKGDYYVCGILQDR